MSITVQDATATTGGTRRSSCSHAVAPSRVRAVRELAPLLCAVASVGLLFAPWVRTGDTARSAYSILAVARVDGVLSGTPIAYLDVLLHALPLLAALGGVAAYLERRQASRLLSALIGLTAIAAASLALLTPALHAQPALWATLCAGAGAVGTSVTFTLAHRQRQGDHR